MKYVAVAFCLLLTGLFAFADDTKPAKKSWSSPPEMKIDPSKAYVATMMTDKGKIVLELFAKDAPKTVNSFVFLAKEGFYDGLIFHRVIESFMIQGGDPTGTGSGGPGYEFENENANSTHGFAPGTLAMANAGPGTNGSQFFITQGPNAAHLKARSYTIFGKVLEGQEVVDAIAKAPVNHEDRPNEPVKIQGITIEEK